MTKVRQMPDDFLEVAATFNYAQDPIKNHYRASYDTVVRWLTECGVTSNYGRPAPDDLAEVLATMRIADACAHYRCASSTLMRWRSETGLGIRTHKRPVPDDFAELAPTMSQNQLLAHYGATNHRMLKRWYAEAGVEPKPRDYRAPQKRNANTVHRFTGAAGSSYRAIYDQRVGTRTIYDDAADTLRRYGPCYRCNERGAGDHKGKFWRFGNVVCTDEELLARAARYERKAA